MFSLQKLAVFALIAAALWLAFRFVGHLERRRRAEEGLARRGRRRRFRLWRRASPARDGPRPAGDLEMNACPRCGTFAAADGPEGGACARPDCPLAA